MRITLDAETFKALASPTRLTVLRALDERRKTLTELSRDLDLNKATVHEHLQLLTAAELVRKRDDEGRKWIYYELTWRGQKLLHPQETTTFNVLLGLGVAAAGGGLGMLAYALNAALEPKLTETPAPLQPAPGAQRIAPTPAASGSATSAPSTSASPNAGAGAPAATYRDNSPAIPTASPHAAASSGGFLDHGAGIALALLAFAALMGLFAWLLHRNLRADPFQPPAGPAPPKTEQ